MMGGAGRRKLALFALVALVAGSVAGACGSPGDGGGSGQAIRLQVSGDREEVALFQSLAKTFEDDGGRIVVDVVAEEEEHLSKIATAFASGSPPDLFVVNYRQYAAFVDRGAIRPVAGVLDRAGLDLDGWPESPRRAFTRDGQLQCLPLNASSMVVYVNRSLFAAGGVPLPAEGWDWEAFRDTAARLTAGDVHGIGVQPRLLRVAPFVWSAGGQLVDDQDAPMTLTLDTPQGRSALGFLAGLVRDGLAPTPEEIEGISLEDRFTRNKLAMVLSSRRDTPRFREADGLDFDVVRPPVAPGGAPVTVLHADGICMAGRANQDAVRFLGLAGSGRGQRLGALSGRIVPMAPEARSAFLDPARPPPSSAVFLDQLPVARPLPAVAGWPEVEDLAAEVLTRLFAGDVTVDAAAAELDDASRRPLARARR